MKRRGEIIPVIAGNIREFNYFIQAEFVAEGKPLKRGPGVFYIGERIYKYISDIRSLRGLRFKSAVFTGTYYKRNDLDILRDEVNFRVASEQKEKEE